MQTRFADTAQHVDAFFVIRAISTAHAVIDILISTLDNIIVNKNTSLLLLDLKKAFDTVNHDIYSI